MPAAASRKCRDAGGTLRRVRGRLVSILALLALLVVLGTAARPGPIVAAPAAQDGEGGPRIDAPTGGARVSGRVEIRGRAVTPNPSRFQFYRLYYGQGAEASALRPIGASVDRPVEDGVLGTWDTATVTPGEYLILLSVYDQSSQSTSARVVVTVEPPPTPAVRPTQAPLVVVTPDEVPTPNPDEAAAGPTPIPELPQLDPNIPRVDIPPSAPGPAIPNVVPISPEGPIQPIQPSGPVSAPTPFIPVGPSSAPPPSEPIAAPSGPSFDPGQSGAPSISAPPPPAPPVVQPYEPPPPLPTAPPPTPFGLPPT